MNLGGEIENGAVVLGGRGKGGMTRIRFLDDYLATKSRIAYIGNNEAIAKCIPHQGGSKQGGLRTGAAGQGGGRSSPPPKLVA